MSKWHYICKDVVCFDKNNDDDRDGIYLTYLEDVYDRILWDNDWVFNNDAIDEQRYLLDNIDSAIYSNDGELVYAPFKSRNVFSKTWDMFEECYDI